MILDGCRNVITIDHTKVAANQTNFPVLISTTDPNWRSTGNGGHVEQTDGGDFLFTLADGVTKLDHEIEKYDPTTGEFIAWVRLPTISSSTDTSIDLYYGNAGAADQWNPTGVWDANYQGVWHLNQGTGVADVDSTFNANNATPSDNPTASTGQIGGALRFAKPDRLTIAADPSLDLTTYNDWTMSAWVKPTSYTGVKWPTIYTYGIYRASMGLTVQEAGADGLIENWTNDTVLRQSNTAATLNAWNYVTISRTATTTSFYLNGVAVGSGTSTTVTTAGQASYIGDDPDGWSDDAFLGLIDEVRVSASNTSSGARSASWIATEYANQNAPGTFVSFAAEERTPPVNSVPGPQTTSEDTALVFSAANGNAISVIDGDAGSNPVEVTLAVTNGTLTLNGVTDLTFTAGDGTTDATMTFRGTVSNVNNALNGLSYAPTANYNGSDTLTLTTVDSSIVSLNIDAGLKGHYTFDDTGDLGNDSSPAGAYDGTVSGATAVVDGTRGNVLSFDGNDYVQMSGHFGNPTNVTLAAWVNLTTADTGGAEVISLGNSCALRLDDADGLKGFIYNGSTWKPVTYATTLAGTGWHHVAYTFDDANNVHKLYLDGVQVASLAETGSISYTRGANSTIGSYNNGNSSFDFNGKIDDARVYSRALTAAEIASLASDSSLTDTDTVAITVTPVNDPPMLAAIEGASLACTENDPATAITATITATDVDNTNLASATVQIASNYQNGQDVLSFTNTANITGSWNATNGTLTLSGSDTVANYQAALRAVKYQDTSDNPSGLTRTVSFTVNDGAANPTTTARSITFVANDGAANSNVGTTTLTVSPVDDAPVLAAIEGTALAYTENAAATAITGTITASDVDNTHFSGATIQIIGNYASGQDVLSFTDTANIAGSWNAANGTLTLSGSDTVGNYQAALRAVTYQNTSENPSGATRTVSFKVNDGTADSNLQTRSIAVTPVNDAPVLDLDADNSSGQAGADFANTWTENGGPVAIADADAVLSDVDNANLVSLTVTLTNRLDGAAEVLSADTTGTSITANYAAGVLTLSGSDTVAHYQQVLRTLTYDNTYENPTTTARVITLVANDGTADSNAATTTLSVQALNDAPVLDLDADNSSGQAAADFANTWTENGGPVAIADADAVLSDVDNANLVSLTVTLTNRLDGAAEVLAADTTGTSITANYAAGVLTLSGSDSVVHYQQVLRTLTYDNTSENPTTTARVVTLVANDGTADSNTATTTLSVQALNDAPVLAAIEGATLSCTENDPATPITATLTASDVDSTHFSGATIQIIGNYQNDQDVLSFTDTANITGSWNAANGTLTLSGSDTVANYQAALRTVTYQNTSENPSGATRTVSFKVNDGTADSNLQTRSIAVTPVIACPDPDAKHKGDGFLPDCTLCSG